MTHKLEERFNKRPGVKVGIILALRLWQASKREPSPKEAYTIMQKANHIALTAHRSNHTHPVLYFLAVFINIEAGHLDHARQMLDKANAHKSFLRTHAPQRYKEFCFLFALLNLKQDKNRAANKHWRRLNKLDNTAVMQGMLHMAAGDKNTAMGILQQEKEKGNRNFFLHEILGKPSVAREEVLPSPLYTKKENPGEFLVQLPAGHNIRHIYVSHREKKGTDHYPVNPSDTNIFIQGCDFDIACFSAGHRTILEEKLTIVPPLPDIYKSHYAQGSRDFFVLSFLAKAQDAPIEVYETLLENNNLTRSYKAFLSARLGQLYYTEGNTDKAIAYFRDITRTAIETDKWDANAEDAFVRLFKLGQPCNNFALFTARHMFINHVRPKPETILALENINLPEFLLPLATCYLTHNITTKNSEHILQNCIKKMEQKGFLLPILKQHYASHPFVTKHVAFLHSTPILNYKINNGEYNTVQAVDVGFGLYSYAIPLLYSDEITYYFNTDSETTAINTTTLLHHNEPDPFFAINNASIYQRMFKYDEMEKELAKLAKSYVVAAELL